MAHGGWFVNPFRSPGFTLCRNKIADLPEAMPIECSLTSGSLVCPVTVTPAPGGCFDCSYTPPAAGFYRLTVTSNGTPVGSSPLSIKASSCAWDHGYHPPQPSSVGGTLRALSSGLRQAAHRLRRWRVRRMPWLPPQPLESWWTPWQSGSARRRSSLQRTATPTAGTVTPLSQRPQSSATSG